MDSQKLFYTLSWLRSFFLSLLFLSFLSMASFASGVSEVGWLSDGESTEIVQDEQTEMSESSSSESDPEPMGADEPPIEPEQHHEIIHNEQNGESGQVVNSYSSEMVNWKGHDIPVELYNLLTIENDGYTDESWQNYLNEISTAEIALSFGIYDFELIMGAVQNAVAELEYLPVVNPNLPDGVNLARIEYHLSLISGFVILVTCGWFFWITVWKPLKSFVVF